MKTDETAKAILAADAESESVADLQRMAKLWLMRDSLIEILRTAECVFGAYSDEQRTVTDLLAKLMALEGQDE